MSSRRAWRWGAQQDSYHSSLNSGASGWPHISPERVVPQSINPEIRSSSNFLERKLLEMLWRALHSCLTICRRPLVPAKEQPIVRLPCSSSSNVRSFYWTMYSRKEAVSIDVAGLFSRESTASNGRWCHYVGRTYTMYEHISRPLQIPFVASVHERTDVP